MDDTGHACQVDDRQIDQAVEPGIPRILIEVDRRQHTDRRRDGERDHNEVESADEGRPDAAFPHPPAGHLHEKLQAERWRGAVEEIGDDRNERNDHRHGHAEKRPLGDGLGTLLAGREGGLGEARGGEGDDGHERLFPPHTADHEIRGQVHRKCDAEQKDPGQEQHLIV